MVHTRREWRGAWGTATAPAGGIIVAKTLAEFRASYKDVVPRFDLDRELVQLGMPTPDRVVVWYAHSSAGSDPGPGPVAVELDGSPLPEGEMNHYAGPEGVATGRIDIGGLEAGTAHEVRVRLTPTGAWHQREARTAPAPDDTSPFSMLAYSCLSPFAKGRVRQRTVNALSRATQRGTGPDRASFALATGDQVYVDARARPWPLPTGPLDLLGGSKSSRRLFQGDASGFFDTLYRAYFSIPPYDRMLQRIPTAMMWDDHDIRDGWGSQGDEQEDQWPDYYRAARRWFFAYQALRNVTPGGDLVGPDSPPEVAEAAQLADGPVTQMPEFHHSFSWGGLAAVFVMDLRSQRSIGPSQGGTFPEARVISDDQLEAVKTWLASPRWHDEPKVFVLATSMPLTHKLGRGCLEWRLWFRRDDRLDNWWSEAAVATRDRLVAALVEHFRAPGHERHRLLVVSGDVHFSELLELAYGDGGERTVFGHEVVSSGLAQAKFHAKTGDRAESQTWTPIGSGPNALTARGRGRLLAPSFAEVFVSEPADPTTPPQVSVRFAAVATKEKGRLIEIDANGGESLPDFTPLPLEPVDSLYPFPTEPTGGSDWDAEASSWD
jgi:phosphodiesterase/alkaline phosphatase D-like protein